MSEAQLPQMKIEMAKLRENHTEYSAPETRWYTILRPVDTGTKYSTVINEAFLLPSWLAPCEPLPS